MFTLKNNIINYCYIYIGRQIYINFQLYFMHFKKSYKKVYIIYDLNYTIVLNPGNLTVYYIAFRGGYNPRSPTSDYYVDCICSN